MSDDVTLITTPAAGGPGTAFQGWTSVRVTRGIDRCPSDFQISATERNPLDPGVMQIFPGDSCEVLLGADLILTGYVDRVIPSLSGDEHSITILGRSKCEDIVDCSAEFQTFQLSNVTAPKLAALLCQPFGISVATIGDVGSLQIEAFNVTLTETPFEIIEEVCRYAGLLAFDGRDGNLILTRAGTGQMASGFAQGQNVQEATAFFTMDQRYSSVRAIQVSNQFLFETPSAGTPSELLSDNTLAEARDPGVLRHRPLLLVAEQNDIGFQVAKQRVQWEVNRRWGRSQQVRLTCDSWRDQAGQLWELNALANVDLPALKITNQVWLIAEVEFVKDERGTRAEVTLMPQQAFAVEPIILNPFAAQIAEALNHPAAGNTPRGTVAQGSAPIPTGGASK